MAADPEAPVWMGWVPSIVCEEIHQLEHEGRVYFVRIDIRAELTGEEPKRLFPVRADLGRRIAEMIRSDCAQG